MSTAAVTSTDRLTFTVFLALTLHAMIILGVTFAPSDPANMAKTLEVTLASYSSDQAPDEADFIAQENQQGSGTLDEAQLLTTDREALFHDNQVNDTSLQEQVPSAPKPKPSEERLVTTTADTNNKTQLAADPTAALTLDLPEGPKKSLLEISREMASLEAKLLMVRSY